MYVIVRDIVLVEFNRAVPLIAVPLVWSLLSTILSSSNTRTKQGPRVFEIAALEFTHLCNDWQTRQADMLQQLHLHSALC